MMRHRWLASLSVAAVIGMTWLVAVPAAGQAAKPAAQKWSVPHTPWGEPDLQGIWTNFDETPFDRPNPDAAAAAREREVANGRYGPGGKEEKGTGRNEAWNLYGSPTSPKRPSLVVDPPNGRVPALPGGWEYRDYQRLEDSYEYHSASERCITRGVPAVMMPGAYNNGYQIIQSPGYVAILAEMHHTTRVIPTDGRPHTGASVRQWEGDSRGHWDGNTLVIDTTNYNDKGDVKSGNAVSYLQTRTLHVVERFTLVDAKTISYEVTVEDPHVFSQPWKVALPLNRDQKYQIFEYACHEGNVRYMAGTLAGGRARDKAEEAARKAGTKLTE